MLCLIILIVLIVGWQIVIFIQSYPIRILLINMDDPPKYH